MLVETKAKVGVFSIALGAYLPQFPTLVPEFEAQYEAFKNLTFGFEMRNIVLSHVLKSVD